MSRRAPVPCPPDAVKPEPPPAPPELKPADKILSHHPACRELVNALGLTSVRKLTLTIEVGKAVMMTVERFASDADVTVIGDAWKKFGAELVKEDYTFREVDKPAG